MSLALEKIIENPYPYQFQQLVRVLENNAVDVARDVEFQSHNQVTFPGSDFAKVTHDGKKWQLKMNFMGLYGVDSPLPHYLNSLSLPDTEKAEALRGLLNIILQQTYRLYYQVWKKHRMYVQLHKPEHDYLRYLRAFSGATLTTNDKKEYSQALLLGARHHNAAALTTGIKSLLKVVHQSWINTNLDERVSHNELTVSIKQFQPSVVIMKQYAALGLSRLQLSDNMLLGERVIVRNRFINIDIQTVHWSFAEKFWPLQQFARQLHAYIKRFLKNNLRYALAIRVNALSKPLISLGSASAALGWSTWLGEPLRQPYTIYINSTSDKE